MWTVVLLLLSNTFMTIAWYGHLKYPRAPLVLTVVLSWLIALPEYSFQVPANRIGQEFYKFTPTQLKVIQEVISLTVFAVFAFFYFREVPTWRTLLAFLLIVAAVFLALPISFSKPEAPPPTLTAPLDRPQEPGPSSAPAS
jgi:uncharacterized protein (DUF486 family)